jgi:hypothetical protein
VAVALEAAMERPRLTRQHYGFLLDVSVNPGWRSAVYEYRTLKRSGSTAMVSRIWVRTIAARQNLVKRKSGDLHKALRKRCSKYLHIVVPFRRAIYAEDLGRPGFLSYHLNY